MPKLLPNRVSKQIDPEVHNNVKAAVEAFEAALGEPVFVSDDELKRLLKVAETRKRITDDVFRIAEQHPDLVKSPLSLEEMRKDKVFYEQGLALELLLTGLLFRVRQELALAGAEYQNACAVFEADIKNDVSRGVAEARTVQAKLETIERKKPNAKKKPPTASNE